LLYLKPLDQIQLAERDAAGDKAVYLGELIRAGFAAPHGLCLTTAAYRETIANPLNEKISARLAAAEMDDPVDLEAATNEIREWIINAPLPPALINDVEMIATQLGAKFFAVRASRMVADVPNPAASGLPQAYLGIAGDELPNAIREIWATPWNSRAIYYRHRKKITQVTMAVVIQPMINAEASGVMFTANPLTGANDEIHLAATWGLGAAVIAARWKPDHFVISKNDLTIREQTIPSKTVMEVVANEGGVQTMVVPNDQQDAASLSETHVKALATLGKQIETHFQAPQDIEWCRVGDQMWILQTRPLKR
jgi:pyruvate,water dikinase